MFVGRYSLNWFVFSSPRSPPTLRACLRGCARMVNEKEFRAVVDGFTKASKVTNVRHNEMYVCGKKNAVQLIPPPTARIVYALRDSAGSSSGTHAPRVQFGGSNSEKVLVVRAQSDLRAPSVSDCD